MHKKTKKMHLLKNLAFLGAGGFILLVGIGIFWFSFIRIPDLNSFTERQVADSTTIYDRTGEIVLYNVHQDVKRTTIPFGDMGANIKNATVAVEDAKFYEHNGIRLTSFIRATLANLMSGDFSQGGSTITQQVVKNTLLTKEKTITRKLKEWILAVKIDSTYSKEEILGIYLNESPYGGVVYGVGQAAKIFFGKEPKDLTLAEAAYLASIPKAPTYYSPYGNNKEALDTRKNFVLSRMRELNFITEEEFTQAKAEVVEFKPQEKFGIKAPHFVFFVKEYLENRYGKEMVQQSGLKVITTLDYAMQEKAEAIVLKYAKENEVKFNGKNAALVAMDPKTGQILTMVGSRDYFDKEIDGNFNVATALRQPGSAFKPFIYATAFKKGFTPDSVLFDLPTEFQLTCDAYGNALPGYKQSDCYMPGNYDDKFRGPMSLRDALAQSINIPAVKLFYLAGTIDSIKTATEMGISTLKNIGQYGLTLVLGGGEVTLVDITSAYGVFAADGIKNQTTPILRVEDKNGNVLEEFSPRPREVLPKNVALMISDVLSDNEAKAPLYGANSPVYFRDRDVAMKTGTTNNYRDVWIMGYTPSLVVGAWAGNNDNTAMERKTSGLIIAPLWSEFMRAVLNNTTPEWFEEPQINTDPSIPPVLRGFWQGGESFFIDSISGKLATEKTPSETKKEKIITDVHTILYWINKKDILGGRPIDPSDDPQFSHWEAPIRDWWARNSYKYPIVTRSQIPTLEDDVHNEASSPIVNIIHPTPSSYLNKDQKINLVIQSSGRFPLQKIDVFVNDFYLGTSKPPFAFSFTPSELDNLREVNELKIISYDMAYNRTETVSTFNISL